MSDVITKSNCAYKGTGSNSNNKGHH